MATFDSLPTELLREILDCLGPVDELTFASRGVQVGTWTIHHYQRTLAAVARTCRRLNHIANEILYCRYEALYQEPAVRYIERFDTDPLVRRRLRHVKITKPLRDICEDGGRYEASRHRVREYKKTFSKIDPFRYGGWTLELVTKKNPELVEVANLVIRAENLETLELEPPYLSVDRESPTPIPFFDSTFCLKEGFPSNPNMYSTLRSLTLDMNNADRPAMFMLLHFPALRELRLRRLYEWPRIPLTHGGGNGEMHNHPQVVAGASKVTILELQDATILDGELVLGMIESCKALERFLLSEKVEKLDHEGVRQARPTYQSILDGLLKSHSVSLKYLELSPDSTDPCIDRCSDDILIHCKEVLEYPRLEGFVGFTALEELRIPMPLLTGRPKGKSIGNTFEAETRALSWGIYIGTERLLPPTLTKLSLTMGPVLSPALGCDYSDLLHLITRHNRITHLNVEWKYYMYQEQLPIDFYDLKRGWADFDCEFDYSIFVRNLSHNPNQAGPGSNKSALDERLDGMAEWLATYGEAGIEMALHFVDGNAKSVHLPRRFVDAKCNTLPRRVLESLNLPPDWQSSDEAREILFGQKLDLDATYTVNWGLDMLQRQRNMKIWLTDRRERERERERETGSAEH